MLKGAFFRKKKNIFIRPVIPKQYWLPFFVGLHFTYLCLHFMNWEKKGTATCISDNRSITMSPSQKFPCVLDDKTAVSPVLWDILCVKNASEICPQGSQWKGNTADGKFLLSQSQMSLFPQRMFVLTYPSYGWINPSNPRPNPRPISMPSNPRPESKTF